MKNNENQDFSSLYKKQRGRPGQDVKTGRLVTLIYTSVYVISPSAKCSWNNIPSNESELRDTFKEISVLALQPELGASTPLLFISLRYYGSIMGIGLGLCFGQ